MAYEVNDSLVGKQLSSNPPLSPFLFSLLVPSLSPLSLGLAPARFALSEEAGVRGFTRGPVPAAGGGDPHGPEEELAGFRLHHHRGRPARRVPAGEERPEGRPGGTRQQDGLR